MNRSRRALIIALAALLLPTAVAWAAQPKLPSTFSGGNGRGLPVGFTLDKHGHVTSAMVAYVCKSTSGIGSARSSHPSGTVSKSGSLTISYSYKDPKNGTIAVKLSVSFSSSKQAHGTATLSNSKCGAPKVVFTATAP